jgi:methyl-accepting chemotaxis protein
MDERRATKVVNPKVQYREALTIVMIFVIAVNACVILMTLLSKLLGLGNFDLHIPGYLFLAGLEILLILGIWRASIVSSHRLAGPVYAFGRELSKLSEGNLDVHIGLRPEDEFQDIAEQINRGLRHLHDEVRDAKLALSALEQDPSPQNISVLKAHLNRLNTSD